MATTAAQTQKRAQQRVQRKIAKSQKYFDYTLLFIVLFLIGFGLVMIYSTSSYSAAIKEGDSLFYLKKQALFTVAGFGAMFFITRFDYHVWTKFLFFAYIVTIILQVLVFVPGIGVEANGSRRWINPWYSNSAVRGCKSRAYYVFVLYCIDYCKSIEEYMGRYKSDGNRAADYCSRCYQ